MDKKPILDADDEKILLLITTQIEELVTKSLVSPLSLDDVKKLTLLHEAKDKINGKVLEQTINIVNRPAEDFSEDEILKELDKVRQIRPAPRLIDLEE